VWKKKTRCNNSKMSVECMLWILIIALVEKTVGAKDSIAHFMRFANHKMHFWRATPSMNLLQIDCFVMWRHKCLKKPWTDNLKFKCWKTKQHFCPHESQTCLSNGQRNRKFNFAISLHLCLCLKMTHFCSFKFIIVRPWALHCDLSS